MKSIEEVIHLYLGCECRIGDSGKYDYVRMVNEAK